jgi:hypothetical protein
MMSSEPDKKTNFGFLTDRKFRVISEAYKWHWYVDSEAIAIEVN